MPTTTINLDNNIFLPVYRHLNSSAYDIDFLWGGRDSGKTRHIAMVLLLACMELPYFRCVLVRKVFNTIKDSQWQVLKDVADEWGVAHLFTFHKNPLEITCVNGNRFICRGMDEPGKLKSISNPSHCWCEEMNQLDLDDFVVIMTSLRYNSGKTKVWCSFNPECDGDFNEYWLYELFFKDRGYNFAATWRVKVGDDVIGFSYQSTWSTYRDNRYCSPERQAFLEQLQFIDPYYYLVYTRGRWGNRKVDDPFCYSFNADKHVAPTAPHPSLDLKISFDFNVNPITAGLYQDWTDDKGTHIRGVEAVKLENSNIYRLCEHVRGKYWGYNMLVTGDATGRNTSALVQDGINYYTVIKEQLNLSISQMKVPTVNPPIKENRVLVNVAFTVADIKVDGDKCSDLIFDFKNVSVDDMGKIDKGDRANPKKRADHLDHFRYYLNTFHKNLLKTI